MQISLQHSTNSMREMRRVQTPGWRKGLRGIRYARLLLYGIIGLWVGAGMILRGAAASPRNTHDIGSGFALVALIVVVCGIFVWRGKNTAGRELSTQVPATLDVTASGISTYLSTGSTNFEPWAAFTSFREGKHTVQVARQGKAAPLFIPTEGLDEAARGSLRSMLLSNLPERS